MVAKGGEAEENANSSNSLINNYAVGAKGAKDKKGAKDATSARNRWFESLGSVHANNENLSTAFRLFNSNEFTQDSRLSV